MFQRLPRITLRMQLALLYAGFLTFGAALLLVPILTIHQSIPQGADGRVIAGIQASTNAQVIRSVAILAGLVLLSLAAGWLIAGRFLRPLRTITATARRISASNLNSRLAMTGRNDEFKDLGATLDSLFERLEASFESQRHFVANASHELRTPLAAERILLQVALADPGATTQTLRHTCQQVLVLGDQQERLIEALLTLASSERGVEQWEPFDLADLTGRAVDGRRHQAAEQGVQVQTELSAARATGDPNLVGSLVDNLVDNALRHNVPGGRAQVRTALEDGRASIWITNTGPVIPPDEVDRLFEPFQQLGRERLNKGHGHGLGLAIVRAIATAHKATLTATARPEGGLTVEVTFPLWPGETRRIARPLATFRHAENVAVDPASAECCGRYGGAKPLREEQQPSRLRQDHHDRLYGCFASGCRDLRGRLTARHHRTRPAGIVRARPAITQVPRAEVGQQKSGLPRQMTGKSGRSR